MRTKQIGSLILGGTLAAIFAAACSSEGPVAARVMEVRKLNTAAGEITTLVPVGEPTHIEKIIGENDLVSVLNDGANIPAKYRPLIDAFGRMSMGCTATHIGNGLVLSAGHCFDAPATRKDNVSCSGTKVEWGVRKDKAAYLTSNCVKILAYETNDNRDYAIYTVDKIPEASVEVELNSRVADNATITIFGHPQLRPLEWSKVCVVRPNKGNPDQSQDWGEHHFSHQCDTEPGNSGSTVLDDTTLRVVGIHDGGLAPWNYATHITDTPLREFLDGPQAEPTVEPTVAPTALPTAAPTAVPPATMPGEYPDLTFGPFENNENRVLAEFSTSEGKQVSFVLATDVEQGYDRVVITSGTGFGARTFRITGFETRTFSNLKTPVTVRFESDSDVESASVEIRNIEVD